MTADLGELERLARAATPGPWQRSGVRRKLGEEDCIGIGPDSFIIAFLPTGRRPHEHAGAFCDAGYMAAANPATILALISRLRAAEGALDGLLGWAESADLQLKNLMACTDAEWTSVPEEFVEARSALPHPVGDKTP